MRRVLAFVLSLLACSLSAETVVRAAYCFESGMCERRADGSVTGLVPEYVSELARITGWKIQPVNCRLEEALAKLSKGEIDLVGGVVATEERRKAFRFAARSTGDCRMRLFVDRRSSRDPDNVRTWKELKIAVGPDAGTHQALVDFLKARGVKYALSPFDSLTEAVDAFSRGEASAVYSPGTSRLRSAKVLKAFAALPCYFCVPKGSVDLGRTLDAAILRLRSEKPDFSDSLDRRLFPVGSCGENDLTDEEREWVRRRIRSGTPIVVDISPEVRLFRSLSRATGKQASFACYLLDEVSRHTGLSFAYLSPTTEEAARERFRRKEAEVWFPYGAREEELSNLRAGIRVNELKPVLVCRKEAPSARPADLRFGLPSRNLEQKSAFARAGLVNVRPFDTPEAALKALLDKRVDAVPMTMSVALLMRHWLGAETSLEFRPVPVRIPYVSVFTLIPSSAKEPCLESVLRKSIVSFARGEIESVATYSLEDAVKTALLTDREWLTLIFSVLFVSLVTVALFFMVYNRRLARALTLAKAGERSRTRFLATMSHEIRTPLNAVIGFAEFLRAPELSKADVLGYADGIHKASCVLLDLINDVLDLAKLDSDSVDMRQGVLDVRRFASDLSELFTSKAERNGVSLRFVLPDRHVGLGLSPLHFRQVLLNLIGNSIKFTNAGSIVVTLETDVRSPETADVRITVADTGIGISSEMLPTIFDPFVQDIAARGGHIYEGTGLGLPLVKRFVEAAGGTVEISSVLGKGTTTVLRVPDVRYEILPEEKPAEPERAAPVQLPKSVVLVDDVPMNLRVLSLHLKNLGITDVRLAASGDEALALLSDRPAEVVLTDMWMPNMDGAELARRLRDDGRYAYPRVVAVTADVASSETFDLTPFVAVVSKPVTREKLVAAFARR